jgi:phosphoesterase RecJ-like protein
MGRDPIVACADLVPVHLNFIPGAASIVRDVSTAFDLVISLDCSDLERLGHFTQMTADAGVSLINIDHHVTNTDFGDVNLVDHRAPSTSAIVLRLLEHMEVSPDAAMATSLLTGIVTDTRGFRTSNVTIGVIRAALQLMELGASLPQISQQALDRRHVTAVRLWGAGLSLLQVEDRVIWTRIPLAMRRAVGYVGNGDAGLVNFLVSADDFDAAVVFVECDDDRVEVGFRAASDFDVSGVALQFGGGGHALAAGCTVLGQLDTVMAQVLAALRLSLAQQRQDHARRDPQP